MDSWDDEDHPRGLTITGRGYLFIAIAFGLLLFIALALVGKVEHGQGTGISQGNQSSTQWRIQDSGY